MIEMKKWTELQTGNPWINSYKAVRQTHHDMKTEIIIYNQLKNKSENKKNKKSVLFICLHATDLGTWAICREILWPEECNACLGACRLAGLQNILQALHSAHAV